MSRKASPRDLSLQNKRLLAETSNNRDSFRQQRNASLSAGLKRKYQPPMRKSSSNMSENQGSGSKTGQHSRPSSSHSNRGNNDDIGDNDLPEGLRGFDKDLIEKIKNEIVDCGDVSGSQT